MHLRTCDGYFDVPVRRPMATKKEGPVH